MEIYKKAFILTLCVIIAYISTAQAQYSGAGVGLTGGGSAAVSKSKQERMREAATADSLRAIAVADSLKTAADDTETSADDTKTSADSLKTSADGVKMAAGDTEVAADDTKTAADDTKAAADDTETAADGVKTAADDTKAADDDTEAVAEKIDRTETEDDYVSYSSTKEYQIADITVTGVNYLDPAAIVQLSGLAKDQTITIPGETISGAIDKLWRQSLFESISISIKAIEGKRIYLDIALEERPRLSSISFTGIKKSLETKVKEAADVKNGEILNDYKLAQIEKKVKKVLVEKGYLHAEMQMLRKADTANPNAVVLTTKINTGEKVKVGAIVFDGNDAPSVEEGNLKVWDKMKRWVKNIGNKEKKAFSDAMLRRTLKDTKQKAWWRFWKRSKYVPSALKSDLDNTSKEYNKEGFRDFRIIEDSIYDISPKLIGIKVKLYEGNRYRFGDISFVGNKKYSEAQLKQVLNIRKGEVYNEEKFNKNLTMNPQGLDINAMYYDDGYLFFTATPVETRIYGDTVDMEIRIHEGVQARFNDITLSGNTRTNDNVILRETRTIPGQLFSRTELINSINALRGLRYFNDEKINADPSANADGSANLAYTVEEVGSDQLELSGGWGAGTIVGTIGVVFNNFSLRNMFNKSRWKPLPSGDGQQFSLRAQSNGTWYWAVSTSFTEPWLGGKKPISLSVSYHHSMQSNGVDKSNTALYGRMDIDGASIGIGQRLRWPDDFFMLYNTINFSRYNVRNYSIGPIDSGISNNIYYSISLSRQNLDAALFPRTGSTLSLSAELTPPWSYLGSKAYLETNPNNRFKWLEYYKISLRAGWYFNPIDKLVLNLRFRMGYMGYYNKKIGDVPPFERFYMGGDGLTGMELDGRELIGLRGYSNNAITGDNTGSTSYTKFTFEIRYPISLNPAAMIYALAFFESGNAWTDAKKINPFKMYKSAGLGVRLNLSSMGMFGLDWGYGFDDAPFGEAGKRSHFHFSINQSLDW
ncbi:MAG: BamA/TamA family outer membrane protein [Bacteroidales bacterium]|jgi:outer membrane protein insertion porin family|nr:BamA/TamA family outer membrane protein [Bacteroidales bacterium]